MFTIICWNLNHFLCYFADLSPNLERYMYASVQLPNCGTLIQWPVASVSKLWCCLKYKFFCLQPLSCNSNCISHHLCCTADTELKLDQARICWIIWQYNWKLEVCEVHMGVATAILWGNYNIFEEKWVTKYSNLNGSKRTNFNDSLYYSLFLFKNVWENWNYVFLHRNLNHNLEVNKNPKIPTAESFWNPGCSLPL